MRMCGAFRAQHSITVYLASGLFQAKKVNLITMTTEDVVEVMIQDRQNSVQHSRLIKTSSAVSVSQGMLNVTELLFKREKL